MSDYPHSKPPFPQKRQLCDAISALPDFSLGRDIPIEDEMAAPGVCPMLSPKMSSTLVQRILNEELSTPILDELSPYLWLVAKRSSQHIDALHMHLIKGRKILVTEDPNLHLIWFYDTVYLKPLPPYLLNHEFWKKYLCCSRQRHACSPEIQQASPVAEDQVCQRLIFNSALGFLRTYAYLIRHQSDFHLAKDYRLIPAHCTWASFAPFIAYCRRPADFDGMVVPRYTYGQIRLNRLNYAVRLLRPKYCHSWWYYHRTCWNTRAYAEQYFAPMLFAFGSISVLLAAFQVATSVPRDASVLIQRIAWAISQLVIIGVGVMWMIIFAGIASSLMGQILFALQSRRNG